MLVMSQYQHSHKITHCIKYTILQIIPNPIRCTVFWDKTTEMGPTFDKLWPPDGGILNYWQSMVRPTRSEVQVTDLDQKKIQ